MKKKSSKVVMVIVFAIVLLLAPFILNSYYIDLADDMLIWATLTLGLNVVVGYAGLLDLGYIAFFAIGGYTFGVLGSSFGWSAWDAIPLTIVFVGVASVIIGFPTLRLKSDYLAIMTLGFGEIIYITVNNLNQITGGPNGLFTMPSPQFFGVTLISPEQFYWPVLILLLLTSFIIHGFRNSRFGRGLLAIRHDELAAQSVGIPLVRYKLLAYIFGAVWAGVAGVLFVAKQTIVSPSSFEFSQSFYVLSALILGGMGSIPGAILGGFIFIVISESLQGLGQNYSGIIFSVAMLVIILLRPNGIWPARTNQKNPYGKEHLDLHDVETFIANMAKGTSGVANDSATKPDVVLETREITLKYGGVTALHNISMQVREGEIFAIIGPNGAGKTSFLNVLSGFSRPTNGQVFYRHQDVTGLKSDRRSKLGIARTFQTPRLLPTMSIFENVILGAHRNFRVDLFSTIFKAPWAKRENVKWYTEVDNWLGYTEIREQEQKKPTELAYGVQRRLEIARCLASRPKLLLLDEPAAGMNETETNDLAKLLLSIRDLGISIILIEHDMSLVRKVSDRIMATNSGEVIVIDKPDVVLQHPQVIESFLGA